MRKRDPDECFEANQTLFWVIIYVACRRYSKHPDLLTTVAECLTKDIWTLLSTPIMNLEAIHALILMCSWPLPNIRFATDPSTIFANIAMNVCMVMGLHTGKGSHPEFCIGSRQNIIATDEEGSVTWIQACILAQRYIPHTRGGLKGDTANKDMVDWPLVPGIHRLLYSSMMARPRER